ncbi:MAG TPA: DEAD/DEAH box helicase [Thermoplasmata archaeon]|nr:DEAD/DEAH box helicase [Thermoplasmata archaeon]HLA46336.1 DEAD/DEAH box helicase [Thermoplasmata archaeon]
MRVADLGLDPRIPPILEEQGITDLYPPQEEAIRPALSGKSLVLAIPTASGKSLVAYLAILKSVLKGGKALYIVPLRALASEKHEDLKAFEPLGVRVGLAMGDYDRIDPNLEKFDVIIATSERADSLLRHRTGWLKSLTVVVADEVHLINDEDRGPTLEVTLAKLRQVNPSAQVIALSATIGNSEEIAAWLQAEHVTSEWRPVPLKTGVVFDRNIRYSDHAEQELNSNADDLTALVDDVIAGGGQALVFVNTRRATESLARKLASTVKKRLTSKEAEYLGKIADDLIAGQEETTSMAARLGRCLDGGSAFHNAGLTNDQRALVETQFKRGRVKCIVATPTLANGINLPARRVIVRDLNRFDVNYGFTPIPVLEVKQMCGRAGRPKYDTVGEAILIAKDEDDVDELIDEYFLSPPEPIESKLSSEPALRVHTLATIATGHANTEEELFDFFGRTFFAHKSPVDELRGKVEDVLAFLQREDFLTVREGQMRATFFGRRTSDLYIDPLSAVRMRNALEDDRDATFYHLWAVCSTPDMPKLYLRRGDYVWVEDKITAEAMTFPVEDYEFMMAEVKTATLLQDWIEERSEDEVTKKFGIGPGDIRRMVDQGVWLMYAMSELGRIFNKKKVRALTRLMVQMQYGIREELLELVQLRGVGRVRARALWAKGYKALRDLQKADPGDLARIPVIGTALAKKIVEQLGGKAPMKAIAGQTGLGEFG